MNELFARWAPRGLSFLALSAEATEVAQSAVQRFGMRYPVAVETAPNLHAALGIKGFPYALLANHDGIVIWRGQPQKMDDQLLESLTTLPSVSKGERGEIKQVLNQLASTSSGKV